MTQVERDRLVALQQAKQKWIPRQQAAIGILSRPV